MLPDHGRLSPGPLLVLVAGVLLWAESLLARPAEPTRPKPLTDYYGDPLPPGAVARLGTVRFRQPDGVSSVIFSQDGKILISAGPVCKDVKGRLGPPEYKVGHVATLWDPNSGRRIGELGPTGMRQVRTGGGIGGIGGLVGGLVEGVPIPEHVGMPLSAGSRSVALWAQNDPTVFFWDLPSRKVIHRFRFKREEDKLVAVAPDSKAIALAKDKIELWDAATGKRLRAFGSTEGAFTFLAFTADGKTLASIDAHEVQVFRMRVWDVATGKLIRTFPVAPGPGSALISPDGTLLATHRGDPELPFEEVEPNGIHLRDMRTGKKVTVLKGPKERTCHAAFSPAGNLFAGVDCDGQVFVWQVPSGRLVCRFRVGQAELFSLAFSPDAKTLVTADAHHTIRLWDVATGKERLSYAAHCDAIHATAYFPGGKMFASGSNDGSLRLWDPATGKCLRELPAHASGVAFLAVSRDGTRLVSADSQGSEITCWDPSAGKPVWHAETAIACTGALRISPDGKRLVSLSNAGGVRIWEMATGKEVVRKKDRLPHGIMALSPDCRTAAYKEINGRDFLFWDIFTGRTIRRVPGDQPLFRSLNFSADGKILAALEPYGEKALHLWEVPTGREAARLGVKGTFPDAATEVALSADRRFVAVGEVTGAIRLWEVATGKIVFELEAGRRVSEIAFAPDARTLVTAGGGNYTLLIWDATGLLRDGKLPSVSLTAQEVDTCWRDLAGDDARRAYRACWRLTAAGDQMVACLGKHLRPSVRPTADRVRQMIAELDSPRFAVRQQATRDLEQLDDLAEPILRATLWGKPTPEARGRIERLLRKVQARWRFPSGERLRLIRAVGVLEQTGTSTAKQVLRKLARGPAESWLTGQAREALARLDERGRQ